MKRLITKGQCSQVWAGLRKPARDAEVFKNSKRGSHVPGIVCSELELEPCGDEEGNHCQSCAKASGSDSGCIPMAEYDAKPEGKEDQCCHS